jgi:hypothetical protein
MEREQQDWRKRAPRRKVSLSGVAYCDDGSQHRMVVTNMGYDGCHIIAERCLSVGETLKLSIPGMGIVAVQVRWAADEQAGVRFLVGTTAVEDRRARLGI